MHLVSDWNGSISATTRPIATINTSMQRSNHCASNREKRGEKALQTSIWYTCTWQTRRKSNCRRSKTKTWPYSGCRTARKLVFSRVDILLLPRNFVHRVQGDPGYQNNRKRLLFARRRAAAADRQKKRALFLELVKFERTLQLEFMSAFRK